MAIEGLHGPLWGAVISNGSELWRPKRRPNDAWAKLGRGLMRNGIHIATWSLLGCACAAAQTLLDPASFPLAFGWIGAGLLTGLGVAALREAWRDTIDLRKLARRAPAPVVGAAPDVRSEALRQLPPDKRTPIGLIQLDPASATASTFRALQAELSNQSIVSFVAPAPGVGATTSALCFAISAAQQGRTVVVLDCDMRSRGASLALGLTPNEGVLEAAETPAAWKDFIVEEEESGVHVLPAARAHNPWRTLLATRLPALIETLKSEYDLVVLDCPPAIMADGLALAQLASRTFIVAAWDQTPVGAVRSLVRRLRRTRELGIIVNRTPRSASLAATPH